MSMTILEAMRLPDEFMQNHCGLCGNSGIVDTRGKMFTAAGVECGIQTWCLCPNGRSLKRASAPKTSHRVRKKPVETFWVSWDDFTWESPARRGPKMIAAWRSGEAADGSYCTVVAWVIASTVAEVIAAVDKDYPCEGERRWRFINPCDSDFTTGDRFPLDRAAKAKIAKLKGSK